LIAAELLHSHNNHYSTQPIPRNHCLLPGQRICVKRLDIPTKWMR
jgi:hypothetical protein